MDLIPCAKCGQAIGDYRATCPFCGASTGRAEGTASGADAAPKPRAKAPLATSVHTPMRSPLAGTGDDRTHSQIAASILGLLLVVVGLFAAVYFFAFFDTSVPVQPVDLGNGTTVGGGRVVNIGLMADRQNGIIVGFGFAIVGGVLMFIGRRREDAASSARKAGVLDLRCSVCDSTVTMGISFCPRCGDRLPWASDAGGSGS